MASWNPWHGCHKISDGCTHCYMYRMDEQYQKDPSIVRKTKDFNLPVRNNRQGGFKLQPGETVYTCFTSDFLIEEADAWRAEAWEMIHSRPDLHFLFITKRIERLKSCLPKDWGKGYEHVTICCTVENQDCANFRLAIFKAAPIRHKAIICEPILEFIDLSPYLDASIEEVLVGGESGQNARICDYAWVLAIRQQCINAKVPFTFRQTGARLKKGEKQYHIPRKEQLKQAKQANIDYEGGEE